jgi:hypothetical protein
VIFDSAGNLYGTASAGGNLNCTFIGIGCGTVFELTPSAGGWTEQVLYTFQDGSDGGQPEGGLIFDGSGNLYGTTAASNENDFGGSVFELKPSGGSWTFVLLHSFQFEGGGSVASLVMDGAGNLYGTQYGYGNGGSVFKLMPSNGSWTFIDLYAFTGGSDGGNPVGSVTLDGSGSLYGTTQAGGTGNYPCQNDGCGVVWEIAP